MNVVLERGISDLATVFAATYRGGDHILEFVDSLSDSPGINEKWVIVVSSQFGCPVRCLMCDTAGYYLGDPTAEELISQVDHIIRRRFPDGVVPTRKFKVQFARMGEPALNIEVIRAIEMMIENYDAPGLMPCISTVAPRGTDRFFDEIARLNRDHFRGNFQLQFSLHSTDERQRDRIMPIQRWSLGEIADYGKRFYVGGRKVSLNFALAEENSFDPSVLIELFDPDVFMVKVTPVNPTDHARRNDMVRENLSEEEIPAISILRENGFDVVVSIGDLRENEIGSNCGQLAALWKKGNME